MTTTPRSALELRRSIAEIYLAPDPPPGAPRASLITVLLARCPSDPETLAMASDFLAVLDLRARLIAALAAARSAGEPDRALLLHGQLGHADAALMGATRAPGWRAMALDMLEPDDTATEPLNDAVAARLLAFAMGLDDGAAD